MKRLFVLFAVLSAFITTNAQVMSTYRVGDYYNDGMKEGIVFEVTSGGKKGKILSIDQSPLLPWTVCTADMSRLVGAKSQNDGQYNQKVVEAIEDWQLKYPAFDWCASLGEGWYLPSKEELKSIYKNRELLNTQLTDKIVYSWSSTESDTPAETGEACAWVVNLQTVYYTSKNLVQPVRAIATFDTTQPVEVTGETYGLGDYYDDGVKQGVVFEVDYLGKRGKIVSMVCMNSLKWSSSDTEVMNFIGVTGKSIGKYNMWQIKERPNGTEVYPLHDICNNLAPGWYIPALDEMEKIMSMKGLLELNLPYRLENIYWTSTEKKGLTEEQAAMEVYRQQGKLVNSRGSKKHSNSVVFVSMFDSSKPAAKPKEKKYKVGDYYNDGKKEGVVFHVTEDGLHGKIVSMTALEKVDWASKSEGEKIIGAHDMADGDKNMEVVKSIEGWKDNYPIFKWCSDLGEGWYLPSVQELYKIYYNRSFINSKLASPINDGLYWSSTEQREVNKFGFPTADIVLMNDNNSSVGAFKKSSDRGPGTTRARAIAVF